MKHKYIVYILIAVVLILISVSIYLYTLQNITENFEENTEVINLPENIAMGNTLICYFYNVGLAFLRGKNFQTNSINGKDDFIQYLPTTVEFNKNVQDAFIAAGITDESLQAELNKIDGYCWSSWTTLTKERETFWMIMKPTVNHLLKQALEKAGLYKNIDAPVIHFRCSDVPLDRLDYYHFQRYNYFKDALTTIQNKTNQTYNKVYICYCNTHYSNPQNQSSCDIYYNSLVEYLQNLGYEVITKCSSTEDDFATMFYAPGLISTSSSLSFMAGFFSDGVFISSMYDERIGRQCEDCQDWFKPGYTLKHSEVQDYHDTSSVISLLQK